MFYLPSVADAFWVGCIRCLRTMQSTNTASEKVVQSSSLCCVGSLGGLITPDLQMIPDSTELAP